jgi:CHRD domain-containing protein
MMKLRGLTVVATIGALSMLATSSAFAARLPGSAHGGTPLAADLAGGNETPPNATTATGSARITVNSGHDEVCWEISFSGLVAPATAAHIHVGPPGVAGPIVLPTPVPPVTSGTGTGCAAVDDALARAIRQDPGAYYVNVHDSVFPAGQIRGQLH